MSKTRYTISEAAETVQVENHVLRYWEEELELDVPRNDLGHRYYTKDNIDTFFKIRKWKEDGYQLKDIKILLHPDSLKKETSMEPVKKSALAVTEKPQGAAVSNQFKMEQFQAILTNIVRNAIEENNPKLGREVSSQVGDRVLKEMNYLMREQDEQEEERYRKLDEAIRSHQQKKPGKKESKKKLFKRSAQTV